MKITLETIVSVTADITIEQIKTFFLGNPLFLKEVEKFFFLTEETYQNEYDEYWKVYYLYYGNDDSKEFISYFSHPLNEPNFILDAGRFIKKIAEKFNLQPGDLLKAISEVKINKTIKRNLETEKSRNFWAHCEKNAREVESWPEWKKGGIKIDVPETSK